MSGPRKALAGQAPFYPALDGLRAMAMIAVLVSHFFPERSAIQRAFHWGRFGVMLFFVLSGFLITGLLLRGRAAVEAGDTTRGAVFRAFVVRRALRIAPIYYLVVLGGWWAGYRPIADLIGWHLTYTGNLAFVYLHRPLAQATHLWSLCVEEQFYLLWPMVVLFLPSKRLVWVATGLVVFSFAYEIAGVLNGRSFEETHLVLEGCMDALGLGALLAIFREGDSTGNGAAHRLSLWAAVLGAPLFFFAQGFRFQVGLAATDRLAYRIPGDMGLALISLALVYLATTSGPSLIRGFLELPPVRYIGRISYGIYLYHLFLIPIGRRMAGSYELPQLEKGVAMFLIYSAVSVAVASVSFYAIERPIQRQKTRFPYPPGRTSPLEPREGAPSLVS